MTSTIKRTALVLILAGIAFVAVPGIIEAQSSGCVAVTYGCGTSSGGMFTQAQIDQALDILGAMLIGFCQWALIFFYG
jgi:hypothetical protein